MLSPGDYRREIRVGGVVRHYFLHVPDTESASKEIPVVLALHGGGATPELMIRYAGLNEKADQAGFLAIHPAGTGRVPQALCWNAGLCCGYAQRQRVDDVAFLAQLLDDVAGLAPVDPRRIYATGISNGGMLAYLLADELPRRIAAVASVAGTSHVRQLAEGAPVPILHFHGTADYFVPSAGGRGRKSLSNTDFVSVEQTLEQWIARNGCNPVPRQISLSLPAENELEITRWEYGGGRNGAEVVLYLIQGGGHTWPGRPLLPGLEMLGPSASRLSANDILWEFFQKHPLPE